MAHRLSTCCKGGLNKTRECMDGFDKMYKGLCSIINVINKSSWRSKMNPTLKAVVPTRFWGNESMFESVIPNYELMKKFAIEMGHPEKVRFRKESAKSIYGPLFSIKQLITQIECRKYPTIHLFCRAITGLFNDRLAITSKDGTYSAGFKKKTKAQIMQKIIPDIKVYHLWGAYFNPLTRDEVYEFDGVEKSVWDGQARYNDARKEMISKFKQLRKLCKEKGKSRTQENKKRGRGRPKKKTITIDDDTLVPFDLYECKSQSHSNIDLESSDEENDEQIEDENYIPKEIQWYESFDVDNLESKEIMRNPLLFYKKYGKSNMFYLEQIAKWALCNQLTSVGAEAIFNDCGMTRSERRTQLTEEIASDIDVVQKWTRAYGKQIETNDKTNESNY